VVNSIGFRRRITHVLTEAQNALNVAFGAILSAYIGNSLAEIDNRPFDHVALAKFFMLLAVFILAANIALPPCCSRWVPAARSSPTRSAACSASRS
jgi:hypothetical protein